MWIIARLLRKACYAQTLDFLSVYNTCRNFDADDHRNLYVYICIRDEHRNSNLTAKNVP
jgi:hypothetical protein